MPPANTASRQKHRISSKNIPQYKRGRHTAQVWYESKLRPPLLVKRSLKRLKFEATQVQSTNVNTSHACVCGLEVNFMFSFLVVCGRRMNVYACVSVSEQL